MNKEDLYNLNTYNYSLPKELIAQYPCEKRDESRLLCYKKDTTDISHHKFYELSELLTANDVLVLNNTKVIPARFYAQTENKNKIEILLVSSISPDSLTWKVLASPKKHLEKTKKILLDKSQTIINVLDSETIKFNDIKDLNMVLSEEGLVPLPPYIKREPENLDLERYQTVFAKEAGAVAAPTASLHFTNDLLEKIKNRGVEILYITLHVGPGTFLPIRSDDIREHKLIPESFYIDLEVWERLIKAKKNHKRIIACGTTTVRAIEYAAKINKFSGLTSLFITPDFEFQITDALITNFHLPKTALLVLASTFAGLENIKKTYEEAVKEKYRFYSYGDAMFIS